MTTQAMSTAQRDRIRVRGSGLRTGLLIEEFGIPRDASVTKIRQAYKTLARVLHPDAHPDEALKGMAAAAAGRA